jgi:hypothetical protein
MARLWRNRWLQTQETELSGFQKLQDLQREGAPRKFSMEQVIKLFALACEPPENCGDRALNVKAATWDGYGASYNGCDCAGSHSHSISIKLILTLTALILVQQALILIQFLLIMDKLI